MKVRSSTPIDLPQLRHLNAGFARYCGELGHPEEYRRFRELTDSGVVLYEEITDGGRHVAKTFVAEDVHDAIVGYISGVVIEQDEQVPQYGVITHFFVEDQEHLRAVGRPLFAALEGWFKQEKCIFLHTDTVMIRNKLVERFEHLDTRAVLVAVRKQ